MGEGAPAYTCMHVWFWKQKCVVLEVNEDDLFEESCGQWRDVWENWREMMFDGDHLEKIYKIDRMWYEIRKAS